MSYAFFLVIFSWLIPFKNIQFFGFHKQKSTFLSFHICSYFSCISSFENYKFSKLFNHSLICPQGQPGFHMLELFSSLLIFWDHSNDLYSIFKIVFIIYAILWFLQIQIIVKISCFNSLTILKTIRILDIPNSVSPPPTHSSPRSIPGTTI